MLSEAMAKAGLSGTLKGRAAFAPYPVWVDRAAWAALPLATRVYYHDLAERYAEEGDTPLPASRYMDFARDGNRSRYEKLYFTRRKRLITLALAECMAGDGSFLDDVIDCVWAVCEETNWVVPAHNSHYGIGAGGSPGMTSRALGDVGVEPYVDLFAAETAAHLAWVYYLLGDRLAEKSPLIPARIVHEVQRRVIGPYERHDDFAWMGLAHEHPVNNWNPWINENVLAATLVIVEDDRRRQALVEKIAKSLDRFLAFYEEDGGCDEGPSYFNVAGGSMLDALFLLEAATDGAVRLWDEPLIQNMARFIYATHIDGAYYVNFADAPARVTPGAGLLLRAADRMGLDDLAAFARYLLKTGDAVLPGSVTQFQIHRLLDDLFMPRDKGVETAEYKAVRDHFFPGIQVAVGRQAADSPKGLFFAAKGGHNGESHNHNDIGNYTLYLDGLPVIVDAGVETYSRRTFSEARYTIWTMQSCYHNTAVLAGLDQAPGGTHAARDVRYAVEGAKTVFSLDMAGAYPQGVAGTAGLGGTYVRTFTFDRDAGTFAVADAVDLAQTDAPTVLPLLTAVPPRVSAGEIVFDTGRGRLALAFDAQRFAVTTETVPLSDAKLRDIWQRERLYRVLLTRTEAATKDGFTLTYTVREAMG